MSLFTAQDGMLIVLILCMSQEHNSHETMIIAVMLYPGDVIAQYPVPSSGFYIFFKPRPLCFWNLQRGDIDIPFRTKQSTVIVLSPSISHEFLY